MLTKQICETCQPHKIPIAKYSFFLQKTIDFIKVVGYNHLESSSGRETFPKSGVKKGGGM